MKLYVSARFENPSESMYDFKAEAKPGSPAQVYVSPQFLQSLGYRGLLQSAHSGVVKIFSAVETQTSGDGSTQSAGFSMDTAPGDKYKPTEAPNGASVIIAMSPMLLMMISMPVMNVFNYL